MRAVYREYGLTWEPDGYHADLLDLEAAYAARGDRFWVAESADGRIVGTVALSLGPGERIPGCDCGLVRLYVDPAARRAGLGMALIGATIDAARDAARRAMEIWSDKRFVDAHRLYRRLGARDAGERICPGDPDRAEEWGLVLDLRDAAARTMWQGSRRP